jgi:dUTPase
MTNIGQFPVHINFGEKIVQAVPYVIDYKEHTVDSPETMTEEKFYEGFTTERGDGAFGSTGTN